MKKIATFVVALCALLHAQAAERRTVTADELTAFFASTTYVVTTNDNIMLDAQLTNAAKLLWKATPFRVAGAAEFDQLKTDSKNSFLMITKVVEAKDKLKRPYLYLALLMGSPDAATSLDNMPEVAFIPLATENSEGEISSTSMLEPMLLFVQKHAENQKEKSFGDRLMVSFQQRLQAYNYNQSQLKGKAIFINKNDVDSQSEMTQAKAAADSIFYFVDEDNLDEVAKDREASAVIGFCVTPQGAEKGAYGYKMLMGADGTLYYYYYESRPRNFLFKKNDFDMIIKNAK
ncbi:MAG: hypothetical protein LBU92_00305 [Prevotellaceae bacterium]|jgi:hypothetical protein|nr:hypothetical protein [Prevotellaceae bacterium]